MSLIDTWYKITVQLVYMICYCLTSVLKQFRYHAYLNFCLFAVHFWAPTFKWGISIANIADFSKPPEKLSYPQQIGMLDADANT